MSSKNNQPKSGFKYIYSQEKYDTYSKVPVHQKLRWLEEINRFLFSFMPPKSKEIYEKLKLGKG